MSHYTTSDSSTFDTILDAVARTVATAAAAFGIPVVASTHSRKPQGHRSHRSRTRVPVLMLTPSTYNSSLVGPIVGRRHYSY